MTDLSLGEATKGPAPHIKRRPSRTMLRHKQSARSWGSLSQLQAAALI
jgi:hypothetical protein